MEVSALLAAFGKSLLFAVAGVLPIINPLASAPVFIDFTQSLSAPARDQLARRIGQNVGLLLIGALLVGSYVLHVFGISLPIVRVAGGLVVAQIAWRMLSTQQVVDDNQSSMAQSVTENNVRIRGFYPLTFPLTCGPGSIAGAITVGASLHTGRVTESMFNFAGGVLAMALIGLLVGLAFRYARRLMQPLGEVGQIVFMRLMAFILLSIGVQIVWDGASALLREL